jgi:hypothetical protein
LKEKEEKERLGKKCMGRDITGRKVKSAKREEKYSLKIFYALFMTKKSPRNLRF